MARPLRVALAGRDEGVYAVARMVGESGCNSTFRVFKTCARATMPPGTAGSAGVEAASSAMFWPDVVLLSLDDANTSRLSCVPRIKALAPGLPVVVISARGDGAAIAQSCAAGADACLVEPVEPADLTHALSEAAQGRPALGPKAQRGRAATKVAERLAFG